MPKPKFKIGDKVQHRRGGLVWVVKEIEQSEDSENILYKGQPAHQEDCDCGLINTISNWEHHLVKVDD